MVNLVVIFSCLISFSGVLQSEPLNVTYSHSSVPQDVLTNADQPLYLTPLLEEGNILKAQQMSQVQLTDFKEVISFSGYFTVDKECESNLFFWFFRAQDNWENAPVVLWLQGGPGAPSMYGLFDEIGPISYDSKVKKRRYTWNKKNNLLFIDQPVGTGFSFTRKGCYATNETEVSKDLYSALTQFYQLFPSLQKNKFYITGESYGGHYVPSISYTIHKNNPSAKYKINLSGLMIGNGLMDVMYQVDYSSYLYQLGLIDIRQRDHLEIIEKNIIRHLKRENWELGNKLFRVHAEIYHEYTGEVSVYNFLKGEKSLSDQWREFVTTPRVRKSLHVGQSAFALRNLEVYYNLRFDSVQSVKYQVEELLENYPIVFYYGQLDIVCAYPMAVNFFRNLQWSGARDYLRAERQQWCVQDQLAGYYKSSHNLHEVLVRAAGHSVPKDQPLWAFELMTSVTSSPAHDPLKKLRTCGNNTL